MVTSSKSSRHSEDGFSIIEVILATAVLGVIMAFMVPTFSLAVTTADESRTVSAAAYQAREYIVYAQYQAQTNSGPDASGVRQGCNNARRAPSGGALPKTFSDGRDEEAFTLRQTIVQDCSAVLSESQDQLFIARLVARKGTTTTGKVILSMYYSVFIPGAV